MTCSASFTTRLGVRDDAKGRAVDRMRRTAATATPCCACDLQIGGRAGMRDRAEAAVVASAPSSACAAAYISACYLECHSFPDFRAPPSFRASAQQGNAEANMHSRRSTRRQGVEKTRSRRYAARCCGIANIRMPKWNTHRALHGTGVAKDEAKRCAVSQAALRGSPIAQKSSGPEFSLGKDARQSDRRQMHSSAKAANGDPYLDQWARSRSPRSGPRPKAARPWLATMPPKS